MWWHSVNNFLEQQRDLQKLASVVCTGQILRTTVARMDQSLQNPNIAMDSCRFACKVWKWIKFSTGLGGSLLEWHTWL